jgi:hypothetical protein
VDAFSLIQKGLSGLGASWVRLGSGAAPKERPRRRLDNVTDLTDVSPLQMIFGFRWLCRSECPACIGGPATGRRCWRR